MYELEQWQPGHDLSSSPKLQPLESAKVSKQAQVSLGHPWHMGGIYISPSLGPIPQILRTPNMRKTETGMRVSQTQNSELIVLSGELRAVFEIHKIEIFHDQRNYGRLQVGKKQEHFYYY